MHGNPFVTPLQFDRALDRVDRDGNPMPQRWEPDPALSAEENEPEPDS